MVDERKANWGVRKAMCCAGLIICEISSCYQKNDRIENRKSKKETHVFLVIAITKNRYENTEVPRDCYYEKSL
jgi:hypothetical protein